MKSVRPPTPPLYEIISQKIFFYIVMASLSFALILLLISPYFFQVIFDSEAQRQV